MDPLKAALLNRAVEGGLFDPMSDYIAPVMTGFHFPQERRADRSHRTDTVARPADLAPDRMEPAPDHLRWHEGKPNGIRMNPPVHQMTVKVRRMLDKPPVLGDSAPSFSLGKNNLPFKNTLEDWKE